MGGLRKSEVGVKDGAAHRIEQTREIAVKRRRRLTGSTANTGLGGIRPLAVPTCRHAWHVGMESFASVSRLGLLSDLPGYSAAANGADARQALRERAALRPSLSVEMGGFGVHGAGLKTVGAGLANGVVLSAGIGRRDCCFRFRHPSAAERVRRSACSAAGTAAKIWAWNAKNALRGADGRERRGHLDAWGV